MWSSCDLQTPLKYKEAIAEGSGGEHLSDNPVARIMLFDGDTLDECVRFPLVPFHNPLFDRLPDGRWVVAGMREDRYSAIIVNPDGNVSSFELGDALVALQCAADGSVWTGHYALWGEQEVSVSLAGLAQLSATGEQIWAFNTNDQAFVDDVECLNVSEQGVFAVTWPGYRTVQVGIERPRFLRSRIEAPVAMAVAGERFLYVGGGTPDDHSRLALVGPPSHSGSRRLQRGWTALIDRPSRDFENFIVGRGDTIHAVTDQEWLRISIDEACDQVREHGPAEWNNTAVEHDQWSAIVINARRPSGNICPVVAVDHLAPLPRHWEPFGGADGALIASLTEALEKASWPRISDELYDGREADPSLSIGRGLLRSGGYGRSGIYRYVRGEEQLWSLFPEFFARPMLGFKVSHLNCTPNRLLFCIAGEIAKNGLADSEMLPLAFFSTNQIDVPLLLRAGMVLTICPGLIVLDCEWIDASAGPEPSMNISPLAQLRRHGELAGDSDAIIDAPRADEAEFVGTITSARKLRSPVAEATGWQLLVSVHRWQDGSTLDLPMLVTERTWRYDDKPKRGQIIRGRAWVQGYITSIA